MCSRDVTDATCRTQRPIGAYTKSGGRLEMCRGIPDPSTHLRKWRKSGQTCTISIGQKVTEYWSCIFRMHALYVITLFSPTPWLAPASVYPAKPNPQLESLRNRNSLKFVVHNLVWGEPGVSIYRELRPQLEKDSVTWVFFTKVKTVSLGHPS